MKLRRNNIIVFNIAREDYGLPPLRETDAINLIGTIKDIYRDSVRVRFCDIFSTCHEYTITISKHRIVEVI